MHCMTKRQNTRQLQKDLYDNVDAASYDIFLMTSYTQRSQGVSIAPAWASDIAFSLNRFVNACNNIFKTLQQYQLV